MSSPSRWLTVALISFAGCSCEEDLTRVRAEIAVEPERLHFGIGRPGELVRRAIRIRSVGELALELDAARIEGDAEGTFRVLRFMPSIIAPGASLDLELSAVAFGVTRSAELVLESDDEDEPETRVFLSIDAVPMMADAGVTGSGDATEEDALIADAEVLDAGPSAQDGGPEDATSPDATQTADAAPSPDATPAPDASVASCPTLTPGQAAGYNPVLAWDGQGYGLIFRRTLNVQHVRFSRMSAAGAILAAPGEVDLQLEETHSQDNEMVSTGTHFGVVWSSFTGLYATVIDAQGQRVAPSVQLSPIPFGGNIAFNSDLGEFGVAFLGGFARIGSNGRLLAPVVQTGAGGMIDVVYNSQDRRYALTEYGAFDRELYLRFRDANGASLGVSTIFTATVGTELDTNSSNEDFPIAWNSVDNEYGVVARYVDSGRSALDPAAFHFLRVSSTGVVLSSRNLMPKSARGPKDPVLLFDGQSYVAAQILPDQQLVRVMTLDRDGAPIGVTDCPTGGIAYYPTVGLGPAPRPVLWNEAAQQITGTFYTP